MMAGRRVARRRPASFVQQLDGSGGGGGLLLARRHKSVVVAKIGGGVLKDSSSSSSLESLESQSGAFCPFLGGENSPIFSHFFPLFLNEIFERKKCVSFFLPKTHFFLRLFFLVKITPQKNVRLKIAFLDTHRAQTSSSSSVHASSANPSRTTFLRRRETTTPKKAPTACT